jgi:hypothetical protein
LTLLATTIAKSRFRSKEYFEKHFKRRIKTQTFSPGDLVLVRNNRVEDELNKKTKPRYLGPYEVVQQTKGGSYVLKELDGTVSRRGVAAFRLTGSYPRFIGKYWNHQEGSSWMSGVGGRGASYCA